LLVSRSTDLRRLQKGIDIRAFWGAHDGLLRRNPAERAHATPKDRPEIKTWSPDELAAFLAFTAQDQELALYHVAAATGMRRGELLGLRWRDVDFEGSRLSVRQQFTRQGNGVGFGPPKSKKSIRTIDVDGETIALLREQQERQLFDRRACGPAYRADLDLVFCRPGGSPRDPNVIGRRFERWVRALRTVPAIGLHGLRHTMPPSSSRPASTSRLSVSGWGTTACKTTLELYGHVTPRMRSNAAVRFGSLLSTARTPIAAATVEK
jgi:integrase